MGPAAVTVSVVSTSTRSGSPASFVIGFIVAVMITVGVALCLGALTSRIAASGSIYSYAFEAFGRRAALTAGAALLISYALVAISTTYKSGQSLAVMGDSIDFKDYDRSTGLILSACVGLCIIATLIIGVRRAFRVLIAAEVVALSGIVGMLLYSAFHDIGPIDVAMVAPTMQSAGSDFIGILLAAVFFGIRAISGYETVAFFGAEAERPLTSTTWAIRMSLCITLPLYILAAILGATGQADLVFVAYANPSDPAVPRALGTLMAMCLSITWAAIALGVLNAASRLIHAMSLDGNLPSRGAAVSRRFRTPFVAIIAVTTVVFSTGLITNTLDTSRSGLSGNEILLAQMTKIVIAVITVVCAMRVLRRIHELSVIVRVCGTFALVSLAIASIWYAIEASSAERLSAFLPSITIASVVAVLVSLLAGKPSAAENVSTSSTCRADLSDVLPTTMNLAQIQSDSPHREPK
nr:APC family permease [Rhodococcus kyotonensis]